jgi:molybdopterin adenylyltransferase
MSPEAGPYGIAILVVSSAADPESAGRTAATRFEEAGQRVVDTRTIQGDRAAIQTAVRNAASDIDVRVVVVVGGAGLAPGDVAPEAVEALLSRTIPGFGELFRLVSYRDAGTAAQFTRATAGLVGPAVVFVVPDHEDDVAVAIEELILPEIDGFVACTRQGDTVPTPNPAAALAAAGGAQVPDVDGVQDAEIEDVEPADAGGEEGEDGPSLPPPAPRWRLGARGAQVEAAPMTAEAPNDAEGEALPDKGWKRMVYDLEAEVVRGKAPDIPFHLEDLAPVMDVLHQAGEVARLKLPGGNMPTLYGYPDLQRPGSKVLMVGWGEPHGEVLALHRYPTQVGTCIEEARGLMPGRSADVAQVSEAITGRVPPDPTGELYAVDHDAVYIQRGKWVYRWDGHRERKEGNPNQALATLLMSWHQR